MTAYREPAYPPCLPYETVLNFAPDVTFDTFRLFIGPLIADGSHRAVYECRLDPSLVVKFERRDGLFMNVREWDLWRKVQGTARESWYAPCEAISPNGTALLMKKTVPLGEDRLSELRMIPWVMWDAKPENFGLFGGRIVQHDYAINGYVAEAISRSKVPVIEREVG